MAGTSQLKPSGAFAEIVIQDWKTASSIKPSAINPVFATIEQTLILKRLGQLSSRDQPALSDADGREPVEALIAQMERDAKNKTPPLDPEYTRMLRRELGSRPDPGARGGSGA